MIYKERIEKLRKEWTGRKVKYHGEQYTVVDVDYNGGLLIDKKATFTETTAIAPYMLDKKEV